MVSRQKKRSSWGLGSSGDKNMRMYVMMPASLAHAASSVPAHYARALAPRAQRRSPTGLRSRRERCLEAQTKRTEGADGGFASRGRAEKSFDASFKGAY